MFNNLVDAQLGQAGTKKVLFKIFIGTTNNLMLNIEYRTRNFEYRSVASLARRKRLRRVSLCLFISIKMIEYLTSTFIIQNSIFDI
jgi:hypothetical protein